MIDLAALGRPKADLRALGVSGWVPYGSSGDYNSHFSAVTRARDMNIILRSFPGRDEVVVEYEALGPLADTPRIIGIKDSDGIMHWAIGIPRAVRAGFRWCRNHTESPEISFIGARIRGSAARTTAGQSPSARRKRLSQRETT